MHEYLYMHRHIYIFLGKFRNISAHFYLKHCTPAMFINPLLSLFSNRSVLKIKTNKKIYPKY